MPTGNPRSHAILPSTAANAERTASTSRKRCREEQGHEASFGRVCVGEELTAVAIPGHSIVRERLRKLRYIFSGRGHVHFYDEREVQELIDAAGFKKYETGCHACERAKTAAV